MLVEGPVSDPGDALRAAREMRGLSVGDVAQALKLAPRQVEAIETNAFAELRGATFARGFVRNYARFLGLDPQPLLQAIDQQLAPQQVELAPPSNAAGSMPQPGKRSSLLAPALAAVLLLLAAVLAGWQLGWFQPPSPVATTPDAPAVQPMAPPGAVLPAPAVEVPPAVAPGAPENVLPLIPPPLQQEAPPSAPPAPSTSAAPAAPATERIELVFEKSSWVEVRDGSGRLLLSRVIPEGATQTLAGQGPFSLVVGKADGVKVSYNGRAVDLAPHTRAAVARLTLPR